MRRLVPTDELPNAFLDADRGAVPELALGTTQVRGREPHVSRLVAVALDPHLTPQRSPGQLDQVVEPHARPAADVKRRGPPRRPGPVGPFHGAEGAVHALRILGFGASARAVPVTPPPVCRG